MPNLKFWAKPESDTKHSSVSSSAAESIRGDKPLEAGDDNEKSVNTAGVDGSHGRNAEAANKALEAGDGNAITASDVTEQQRRPSSTPSNRAQAVLEEAKNQTANAETEDETEYPRAWKLTVITAALMLSVFCMALDNTIIATAIPRITDQFNSIDDVGWYGSAYLLTTCAFQLFYGKLYTFYSIKWTYLIAFAIFEVGSVICGAAPNSVALILGRAVAGLGSAGIFAGAILIVAHTVPLKQRPIYTGLIGSMYGIASVAGPLLGGAFTDKVSWRWCFYINLPIGAVTAVFIIFFFTSPAGSGKQAGTTWREKLNQLDPIGTLVFIPAVVALLLALQWGGSTYPWSNWRIIICFIFFGLLIIAFIGIQIWKGELATVPPRVFKQRTVWSAAWFAAMLGGAFFNMIYYLPIWFQAIKGVSAEKSGIMNLAMLLGVVIMSVAAGALVTTFGYYTPFCLASAVCVSIGGGLLTTFTTTTNHSEWIGYSALFGIGIGMGMQQPLIAVQAVLPLPDVPVGTATIMFCQTLGGALFISVGQNVFSNQLLNNLIKDLPDYNPAAVLAVGATTLKSAIPAQYLQQVLRAYNDTLTQVFYVSVALGALSIFGAALMEWKSVKGKKVEATAA
ncbi:MAG: hypothetical protein Q9162_005555 [Coniocarpon cinnabarinum]